MFQAKCGVLGHFQAEGTMFQAKCGVFGQFQAKWTKFHMFHMTFRDEYYLSM